MSENPYQSPKEAGSQSERPGWSWWWLLVGTIVAILLLWLYYEIATGYRR